MAGKKAKPVLEEVFGSTRFPARRALCLGCMKMQDVRGAAGGLRVVYHELGSKECPGSVTRVVLPVDVAFPAS